MKNKIFLSLVFIVLFLIVMGCNADVRAFTFEYDDYLYDTSNYDGLELLEYNIIGSNGVNGFSLVSSSVPLKGFLDSKGSFGVTLDGSIKFDVFTYFINKDSFRVNTKVYSIDSYSWDMLGDCVYTNYDLVNYKDGSIIFNSNNFSNNIKELILYKSTNDYTTNLPLVIYSQDFNEDNVLKYNMQYSKDNANWIDCSIRSITSFETGNTIYQFKIDVYENGTYYFRLQNEETREYLYNSVIVDNIVYTQDNYNNYINGEFVPQPWFSYDYMSDTKIKMYSQAFTEDEIRQLECSYGKDLETADLDNDEKWSTLDVESSYSEITRSYEYRFILYVDNSNYDGDGDYYFRFYIKDKDKYTYSSFNVIFEEIIKNNNNLNKEETNKYLALFRDRFGFLFYPFDLFINIFDHLSNISFEEPVINIPDIYEPFTDVKIISAIEFNFNDLLENDILKNVHDIYLILVDGCVVFGLSNLLYKKLMGVLGNG